VTHQVLAYTHAPGRGVCQRQARHYWLLCTCKWGADVESADEISDTIRRHNPAATWERHREYA